jgi:hypothetical protein
MRQYLLIIFTFFALSAKCQFNKVVKFSQYAIDSFSSGFVKTKDGKVFRQILNYNIITGEMIFNDGGKLLAIAEPGNVDTVIISGRSFIPYGNKFYELLAGKKTQLLPEFTYKIDQPGTSIGYRIQSENSGATSISTLIRNGSINDLKLPDDFKVIADVQYWILQEGKISKAGSASQFAKIFPDQKDQLKQFAKDNNIDFSKKEDLVKVVNKFGN